MLWSSVYSCPVPQGEGSQWLCACGGLYMNTPGAANPQGSWERSGHASTVTSALEKFPASPSCRTKTHGMRAVHSLWPSTGRLNAPQMPTRTRKSLYVVPVTLASSTSEERLPCASSMRLGRCRATRSTANAILTLITHRVTHARRAAAPA